MQFLTGYGLIYHFFQRSIIPKLIKIIKLSFFLLSFLSLQAYSNSYSQNKITLSEENASLEKIFQSIKQQSGYTFFYKDTWMAAARKVNIHVKEASINEVLNRCFENQPFTYSIIGKTVVIKPIISSTLNIPSPPPITPISGKVTNEKGEPVTGAGIKVKGSSKGTVTNEKGEFQLDNLSADATLVISFIGYELQEIKPAGKTYLQVQLKPSVSELDQVQIIAYGTTTKRLNTGDVSKITSEEIEKQPVSNVLAALEGRVPGLIITQANGLPGSAFKVQLRGQSSIGVSPGTLPANNPLFIIDGVPYAPNNNIVTSVPSALGTNGVSPLVGINMADIESIEVLKDADATSIYGSRGANGVVLITTKKGKSGNTKFNASVYTGGSHVLSTMQLLNTQQYITIRKEALANDGKTINATSAPELFLWDSTRYTDFKKMFIGNTAHVTDAQLSISGGSDYTQFLISGNYHHETTVFPTSLGDNKGAMHFNLNHSSGDQKFKIGLNLMYVSDKNTLPGQDLTQGTMLAPNAPSLRDSSGNLNWMQNGYRFSNPLAFLYQPYSGNTTNLLGNLQLSYLIFPHVTLRTSFGYNTTEFRDLSLMPLTSLAPGNTSGIYNSGDNYFKSWIIEPQAEYANKIGDGVIDFLIGGTWQENNNVNSSVQATGFSSDALLTTLSNATSFYINNSSSLYHYNAGFARLNYNWKDKYVLNLSGRRDGSSRFGPGKQFGNFGSIGAAWIFTNESWLKNKPDFLSFGKIRGSYGSTGNDQIGDYMYYDTWQPVQNARPYGTISGIQPTQLFNGNFQWEVNRKLEMALDLSFFKERINISVSYYQNRSSNELIAYAQPAQTGFNQIAAENFPATVQNTGLETVLSTKNIVSRNFSWTSRFMITVPKNKLISFPGLESSSYASTLIIGQPLNIHKAYQYLGVNPTTGLFQFAGKNGPTSTPVYPDDLQNIGSTDPKFYGGFYNTLTFKGLQLDLFFEGRKQMGISYLQNIYNNNPPGAALRSNRWNNEPVEILNRWQNAGDQAEFQKLTATRGTAAFNTIQYFQNSNGGLLTDASFIRLKSISLSYTIPPGLTNKWKVSGCTIFFNGQNLLTLTSYKVSDPETQNVFGLPPVRTFTGGIRLNF